MAAGRPSTPRIVVYHLPIKRLPGACADKYAADREMRAPNQAGENIMRKRAALLGFLAMLVVGNLPGSAEAWWGGGCYRSPCYPRYYRPYYPRYYGGCGGCGGYYRGCGGCGGFGNGGCGGCGGWGRGAGGGYGYGGYGGYGYGGGGYGGYGGGGYGGGYDGYGW
jgi:hypothetical protein